MANRIHSEITNIAVRLDQETKCNLSMVAQYLGRSEKDLAIEALNAFLAPHLPGLLDYLKGQAEKRGLRTQLSESSLAN